MYYKASCYVLVKVWFGGVAQVELHFPPNFKGLDIIS